MPFDEIDHQISIVVRQPHGFALFIKAEKL